ncbi:MAG: metallophosphoesterase [Actinobacteria bacterium]|nr:metallophosphoesterase [Actinomycetota bacterium]
MRPLKTLLTVGGALAAYSTLIEPRSFRLQQHRLEVRPELPKLRILHLGDAHVRGREMPVLGFLRSLPELLGREPDVTVFTGDLIDGNRGIEPAVEALNQVPARLGRFFVLGSHDYWAPKFESYLKYFTGNKERIRPRHVDTDRLRAGLEAAGWIDLTNRDHVVADGERRIRLSGVDDPYLKRHRLGHVRRGAEDLAIGVMHSPDLTSQWALEGFDLILGGHTHGGQVRIPLVGALTTNSSLPNRLACGPFRIGDAWLHVTPGLGTGPYARIRFNCPPEATLLELAPA